MLTAKQGHAQRIVFSVSLSLPGGNIGNMDNLLGADDTAQTG
jgi:hypothetical protein